MTGRRYPWPRFWTKPGENIDDGFFASGSSILTRAPNAHQMSDFVDDPCLVLLGEPGLGKSHAIDDAIADLKRAGHTVHLVDLGAYEDGSSLVGAIVDSPTWREWRESEDVLFLFLDGLDEALLHIKAVHKRLIVELKALDADIARLRLRISCRSAEWLTDFDGQLADVFRSSEMPPRLALAPLRAGDAAEAARSEGLDPDRFLTEVFDRDLGRLAAFPLTLRMMIDIAASGEGTLPATQSKLFDHAILRLAEEHDPARRRELTGQGLHVGQRVIVAERIAAAMMLAGKAAIHADLTMMVGGDLNIRELEGFTEQDPEAAGGASFPVRVAQIQEVLATALFVDIGGGRLTFAHRSLGEYLAARYLGHHHMDAEQIMSLLASPDDPDGRLIPQLREVAAWAATLDDEVLADVMRREPELLLRADGLSLPPEARVQVVASLLTEDAAMRVERYDRRIRRAFAGLVHPGLPDQIRDALRPENSILVQQMAFALAQAAAMPELQEDLVAFALSNDRPAYLRDDAIRALKEYADAETRLALVPLATDRIESDEDDGIKGQALAATFRSPLTVLQVLEALTPARDEHLFGAYKVFVSRTLPQALRLEELPEALEWAQTVPRDHGATDLLASLADDILAAAWPHLDDDRVRAAVVAVIKPRLIKHQELLGPLHDSNDGRTFQEQRGRRLLVEDLMQEAEIEPQWLDWSRPALVLLDDYPWVVAQLRKVIGEPAEAAWAALAAALFSPELCDIDEMFELAEASTSFSENTASWRTPVALDSDLAQGRRLRAERQREAPPPEDSPDMDRVIADHLESIDAGDVEAWWRLNWDLIYDEHGRGDPNREIEADLTVLDGWTRSDDGVRSRIIDAAHRYLALAPPDPDEWLEKNIINRPAFAGYRALYLLAKHRPARLEGLTAEVWSRWMPIIVGYPRSSGIDDERFDDIVVGLAAERAPDALAQWTVRMIDLENAKGEGHLFVLSRLRNVTRPELVEALGCMLNEPGLKPVARGDLAEYGMRTDAQAFLPFVSAQLTREAIERDRDAALVVAAAALSMAPGPSHPLVEDIFRSDPELGKAIFEKVAYGERVDLANEFDDQTLHRLLDWLFEYFPPAEDPALHAGASFVTPRDQAAQVRDRLLAALAQRGTDEAVTAVDALAVRFPSYGMTRRKIEARDARLARWTAPEPYQVIELAQSNDARIVLSDAHLQQALMASLRRIEKRLQANSPPAVRELWNTRGKPTPKYEEELSTWLKGRLEDDLDVGGRVIGRELEIRANTTGRGRGESVDIAVFAPIGAEVEGAATASVTIEVKGCWHADVKTAMRSQLVDRYLTGTGTEHGIYVVFWFAAKDWDPADSRRRRGTDDPQALHGLLSEQAQMLTTQTHATVRSFVMDGSLPDSVGRVRRIRRILQRGMPKGG